MKIKYLITGALIISMLAISACGKKQEDAAGTVETAKEAVSEAVGTQEEILGDFTGEMDLTGSWQEKDLVYLSEGEKVYEDEKYRIYVYETFGQLFAGAGNRQD